MNILPPILFTLSVLFIAKLTNQDVLPRALSENSHWSQVKGPILQSYKNSTIILDFDERPRDKRALGILLQGLVQALGYNSTPIQLATLPNPNTTGTVAAGPINLNIRQPNPPIKSSKPLGGPALAPIPAATSNQKQRETLRFTGVVNFGNNSDILRHLQQYEQIFHSSTSAKPPVKQTLPASTPKPTNATKSQGLNALLEPYFVPIPIPLSPNIQNIEKLEYPQNPLFSIVPSLPVQTTVNHTNPTTIVSHEYVNKEHKETHNVRSEEIIGERNPNLDERQNNNEKIVEKNKIHEQEIIRSNEKRPTESVDASKEYNQEKTKNYHENESNESNESSEEDTDQKNENSRENDGKLKIDDSKREYSEEEQSENSEEKVEPNREDYREENISSIEEQEESLQSPSRKSSSQTITNQEYDDKKKLSLKEAEEYTLKASPNLYLINLPIEEKPLHGPLINSYGEILQHEGIIDENVADYFQNYTNTPFRVFEASSINRKIQKRPWWIEGTSKNSQYTPLPRKRYEEYPSPSKSVSQTSEELIQENGETRNRIKKERLNVNKYKEDKSIEPIESEEKINDKIQLHLSPSKTFDFIKYRPYLAPVQYLFSPDELEQSAQALLTNQPLEKYKKTDKQIYSAETNEESDEEQSSGTSKNEKLKMSAIENSKKQLYEDESREIKAWLMPFYLSRDNTEPAQIIQPIIAPTLENDKIINNNARSPTYLHDENLSNQPHYNNQSRLISSEISTLPYQDSYTSSVNDNYNQTPHQIDTTTLPIYNDSDSSVQTYTDNYDATTNNIPLRHESIESYINETSANNKSESLEEAFLPEYIPFDDSRSSSIIEPQSQFEKESPTTGHERVENHPDKIYDSNESKSVHKASMRNYPQPKLDNNRQQPKFTLNSPPIQASPLFKQYEDYINYHRGSTEEISAIQPPYLNDSVEKKYLVHHSEQMENFPSPVYENSQDSFQQQYTVHKPQLTNESLLMEYIKLADPSKEDNVPDNYERTYDKKEIKIPITTYNPITFQLYSPSIDNISLKNQQTKYQYPHYDYVNEHPTSAENQPKYYISHPESLSIYSDKEKVMIPVNDYNFGERIDQSNKPHYHISENHEKNHSKVFILPPAESIGIEANRDSTVDYKNPTVSDIIPFQRTFTKRPPMKVI